MAEYVSSFITGFQDVVRDDLQKNLKGVKILGVYDGLIHYSYSGDSRNLEKIIYFNNSFFIIRMFKGKKLSFSMMINEVSKEKKYYLINKGTFRVRFVQENQFAKVDKSLVRKAEQTVLGNSKLRLDRLSPSSEIWYSIRREGFGFCGQLISKREFTEKNLHKGELRPEIAYLICSFAGICEDDVVYDPFCGYGSIPVQVAKRFCFKELFASDIDEEKISLLEQSPRLSAGNAVHIFTHDVFNQPKMNGNSVTCVITDPPWGFYEDIGDIKVFYDRMFSALRKVLAEGGRAVILSARKDEITKAASDANFALQDSLHTLVNGKKAGLYKFICTGTEERTPWS